MAAKDGDFPIADEFSEARRAFPVSRLFSRNTPTGSAGGGSCESGRMTPN
jgi:hypothetical protein